MPHFLTRAEVYRLIQRELPEGTYPDGQPSAYYSTADSDATAQVVATLYGNLSVIYDNYFAQLANEKIADWELKMFGYLPAGSLTLSQRQDRVLAKIRAKPTLNPADLITLVQSIIGSDKDVRIVEWWQPEGTWVLGDSELGVTTILGVGRPEQAYGADACDVDPATFGMTSAEKTAAMEQAYSYDVNIYRYVPTAIELDLIDRELTSHEPSMAAGHHIFSGLVDSITDESWTARTPPVANEWAAVAWSPALKLWCAVSYNLTSTPIATSPDGVTWTMRTAPVSTVHWQGICWAPSLGLFCAVGNGGYVMTSADGINWTATSIASAAFAGVCWSPDLGLFCVTNNTGNTIYTSANGTAWTPHTLPSNFYTTAVCASPTRGFCIFGYDGFSGGVRVATSADGSTWVEHTPPSGWGNVWNVAWSPTLGLFCAAESTGTVGIQGFATSPDGVTWTKRTAPSTQQWQTLIWDSVHGCWVSLAFDGTTTTQFAYSFDGVTWYLGAVPSAHTWIGLALSPDLYQLCAVADDGSIMTLP